MYIKRYLSKQLCRWKTIRVLRNALIARRYRRELLAYGKARFEAKNTPHGSLEDYNRCAVKYFTSYEEYMYQFELWDRCEAERNEFMSQNELRLLYNKLMPPYIETQFWDKSAFLRKFKTVVKRQWLDMTTADYAQFENIINNYDCIAKPVMSSCGNGVFKIEKGKADRSIFKTLKDHQYIIEQCISNEPIVRAFHPQSLNTVRIVTVKGKSGAINVLGAFIRFGTGSNVVDNGGNDGLLAMIDYASGQVITDAFDKSGVSYEFHPDSKLKFKGFIIPRFSEMIDICKSAASIVSEVPIIGWDIAVRADNVIDIIEGNHRPDAYGLQTPVKQGYRTRLLKLLDS